MTPWRWWAGYIGSYTYDLACDCASREEAIGHALGELKPGEEFEIIQARSSEAREHEGSDFVPFLRTRNSEVLTAGLHLLSTSAADGAGHCTASTTDANSASGTSEQ